MAVRTRTHRVAAVEGSKVLGAMCVDLTSASFRRRESPPTK
jgi:hypothetical protein